MTARELLADARAIYRRHSAGCCLHLALDDGNIEDSSVDFCIRAAAENGHAECESFARRYRTLTRTQRRRLRYLIDTEAP